MAPDPARSPIASVRSRLDGLGSTRRPEVRERREGADPAGRVGWPGAAPGTPAARMRLPVRPELPDPDEFDDPDDPDDLDELDGPGEVPAPSRRSRTSAWSERSVSERLAQRWVPESLRGARLDPGRLGALALGAVALVAAVVVGLLVWGDRPTAEPVPALPVIGGPSSTAPGSSPAAPAAAPGPMIVSVAGKVARPGLVRLPDGARVGDALDAAGGPLAGTDLTALNLAARVSDGEQVLVGVDPPPGSTSAGAASAPAATPPGAASSSGAPAGGAPAGGRVDLNSATLEQLDQLPGVGPVTAKKILDWRTQNGRFTAVEQLREISGIGEARFATLRDVVTV